MNAHTYNRAIIGTCKNSNAQCMDTPSSTSINSKAASKVAPVNSVVQPMSKKTGGESKAHLLKPMVESVSVARKQSRSSLRSTISTTTGQITVKKVVEDGDSTSGLQNKDTQKIDIDSSVTTVIVRVGSTENVRINCPAVNAAFIVKSCNAYAPMVDALKEIARETTENLGNPTHAATIAKQALALAEGR